MGRKNEFKPDKTGSSFLSRLYLTQKQRQTILKWSLYALLILGLSVLQDVILSRFQLMGATTDLVPVGIMLVCLLEGAQGACVFVLSASALHLFSGGAPGLYSMVFITFLSILITIFRQAYLQEGFATSMLCLVVFTMVYELLNFAMSLFLGLTLPGRVVSACITGGLSLICVPLLYPLCLSIRSIGGDIWKD